MVGSLFPGSGSFPFWGDIGVEEERQVLLQQDDLLPLRLLCLKVFSTFCHSFKDFLAYIWGTRARSGSWWGSLGVR